MTDAKRLEWEAKLDAAEASGDKALYEATRKSYDREIRECTSHNSERCKRMDTKLDNMLVRVDTIERNMIPPKTIHEMKDSLTAIQNELNVRAAVVTGAKGAITFVKELIPWLLSIISTGIAIYFAVTGGHA